MSGVLLKYAEVILPLPLEKAFTYSIPDELSGKVSEGFRAVVPFGKKKIYTGIILKIHAEAPDYSPRNILDIIDDHPIINENQRVFFQWIAGYYMCTLGEVVNAALPSALKLSSESFVGLNPEINPDNININDREWELLRTLKTNDLSIRDVSELLSLKRPQKMLKDLSEKGYINLFEKVKDKYRPKIIKKIRLLIEYLEEDKLKLIINRLESKPKQQDVLLSYLKEVPILENPDSNKKGIAKSTLLTDGISPSSVKTLIKNHVFEEFVEKVSRLASTSANASLDIRLSPVQENAKSEILKSFESQNITLLNGITGSGKTEIYIELIKAQINRGEQVLYLLPEIALTTQIIARLHKIFRDDFGVYHSKYSDNERVEVWQKVLKKEYQFVVGVRSAVFLPFENLGLIIVDEEHEPSYKQFDPAPRYHARDAAIYLATIHQSKVLLGTATPSLESYKNALDGKYALVELNERYGAAYKPKLSFANMSKERKQKKLKGNFSSQLVDEIQKSLERKDQVIIFQNRRGYASYIACENCATVLKCPNCSVSLTYHQYNNKLVCHYCGHNRTMYTDCLHCGSKELKQVGFGTEELEEELKILFPDTIVQRMDLDTTRNKYGYQKIIEEFEDRNVDILVGTQMVSKGLDFDRVNLVGIFDTDRMIHFPDFRSHERSYQLITQVSGRAGRKSKNGLVIIQTNDPNQPLLKRINHNDYRSFYQGEILEREKFHYPPFSRMINIIFKHKDKKTSSQAANFYFHEIRKQLSNQRIIGPVEPLISKIRNLYLSEVTLKLDKQGINLPIIKDYLKSVEKMMKSKPIFRSVSLVFDVDPI
ncbi:MAG: primosomal protein N' [Ekhidna sp.]|nr:primosomal protein N' [Ekhidna sp.]